MARFGRKFDVRAPAIEKSPSHVSDPIITKITRPRPSNPENSVCSLLRFHHTRANMFPSLTAIFFPLIC